MGKDKTPKTVEIIMIVDRSGSMQGLTDDTIGGFNQFLSDQQQESDGAVGTLVLFNHNVATLHEARPLADIPPLDRESYKAEGMTALLDAVGSTVKKARKRHKKKRPDKTVACIITDGHENRSSQFTKAEVATLIEKCQDKLNWDFFFLGANIDVFAEAGGIGIPQAASASYAADAVGVAQSYTATTKAVRQARMSTERTSDDDDWKSDLDAD